MLPCIALTGLPLHPLRRAFQLDLLSLPAAACLPAPSRSLQPDPGLLHPGARVLVLLPGRQLWEPAEVADVDAAGQRVAAITLADRQRRVLPLSAVALSAHAPDPYGSDSEGQAGGAPGAADSGDEGSSSGSGSGSDMDFASEEEGEGGGGGEEDDGSGYGGAPFARVSLALAEAAGLLQQQACAGPQSDTTLFFSSEAHSRGIGSKVGRAAGRWRSAGLASRVAGRHWSSRRQGGTASRVPTLVCLAAAWLPTHPAAPLPV